MFVFPLGLQAKTKTFPWMTTAIFVATTMYAVLHFDAVDRVISAGFREPVALKRFQKQKELALAACPMSSTLTEDDCALLKATLRPERAEAPGSFILRLAEQRARLTALGGQAKTRQLIDYTVSPEQWIRAESRIRGLKEFSEFEAAYKTELWTRSEIAQTEVVLTRSSFNWKTLLRSLFLHAGWMHLIGNMLFLLLFAIPLESRVGSAALALIYFAGGGMGMTFQLLMTSDSTRPLLGASASVAAIGAAFMVVFWSFRVRVWVSLFFVFNQVVLIPSYLFFAAFFVMEDIIGVVSVNGDGVAHFAHLGGFAVGVVLGMIAAQIHKIAAPFVFPFELELFLRSRQETDNETRLATLREILFYNPENSAALIEGWKIIQRLPTLSWSDMPKAAKVFLAEQFGALLHQLKTADPKMLRELIACASSSDWPRSSLVKVAEIPRLVALTRELAASGLAEDAMRVATLIRDADPTSAEAQVVRLMERRLAQQTPNKTENDAAVKLTGF